MKCQGSRRSRRGGGEGDYGKGSRKTGRKLQRQTKKRLEKRKMKMFKDDERRSHWYKYGKRNRKRMGET
jgi:hypothetical protein